MVVKVDCVIVEAVKDMNISAVNVNNNDHNVVSSSSSASVFVSQLQL